MSTEDFREVFRTPGISGIEQDNEASEYDWGPGNTPFKGATIAQGADYCGLTPEMKPAKKTRRH